MELHWIWEVILIFFIGTFILRIGGRKSISQMTISQTIVMIGLGSLLIQPVAGHGLFVTFAAALLLTVLMIFSEYLSLKIDILETLFTGKAVMVIENGKPILNNLKKIRLSLDKLETRVRQAGIPSLEDIQYATIEVSGQLGYELKENKKPITKEDFIIIMNELSLIKQSIGYDEAPITKTSQLNPNPNNIFLEVNNKNHEGNKKEP
ncbi:DUF421 domain-containing protein [Desulfosporosinus meridiei]|uniref:Putative membrane protein n=1 Tax=Desulfosporosinus meridiei (strain ATCC BAA-275 / DSM 13257 / KCTC 12902 / NCIMB 13706 / S10) TaxID=768704 RepID=J7IXN4_DESMD|nr:YetF domain-containing protein [Desulfosporosinus meridiei]AFQ43466.1 putative membrane protein [Desulfosporosinus meridiei DSM 13257]